MWQNNWSKKNSSLKKPFVCMIIQQDRWNGLILHLNWSLSSSFSKIIWTCYLYLKHFESLLLCIIIPTWWSRDQRENVPLFVCNLLVNTKLCRISLYCAFFRSSLCFLSSSVYRPFNIYLIKLNKLEIDTRAAFLSVGNASIYQSE